ncbi:MAG: hypothetical protein Q8T08_19135 [Ignavibacteria bacterium]|nr:hypothetical protein [Ignavibacteria bacterium]
MFDKISLLTTSLECGEPPLVGRERVGRSRAGTDWADLGWNGNGATVKRLNCGNWIRHSPIAKNLQLSYNNKEDSKRYENKRKLMLKDRYLKFLSIFLMALTLTLLYLQVSKHTDFQIDQTTILLLGVLIICGLIPFISKLKIGTVEADLTKDAENVINKSEKNLIALSATARGVSSASGTLDIVRKSPSSYSTNKFDDDSKMYMNLLNEDPNLALAKLRIDIETSIKQIYEKHHTGLSLFPSRMGLRGLVDELYFKDKVLNQSEYSLIKDILPIVNRAVHGETIQENTARDMILLGQKLLEVLNSQK